MKILFWRTEFYGAQTGGGVASLYKGLTDGMLKLGNECHFASSGRLALDERVKTYYIPYSGFFRNLPEVLTLPYIKKSKKEVIKIIEKVEPDLLFQHHHDFNYGGSLIKQETGLPFFLHCDYIQIWVKEHWGKLYLKKLLKWAEEIQWANADRIFVVSSVVREMMSEYGVDKDKIIVNPNGANTSVFHPERDGSNIKNKYDLEGKFVIGFSGTFGNWHGVEVLARSIRIIADMIPGSMIFFIGDGELRPEIEKIIKEDNVEKNAIITGFIPYAKVPEYLAACDVLVSPCLHSNDGSPFFNSPIKLFEYLAMGKPIVASNIGQQGEVIDHKENGLLCEERSAEDLANKIHELYKDEKLSRQIAKKARQDSIAKYSWSVSAGRIINAYNEVKDH